MQRCKRKNGLWSYYAGNNTNNFCRQKMSFLSVKRLQWKFVTIVFLIFKEVFNFVPWELLYFEDTCFWSNHLFKWKNRNDKTKSYSSLIQTTYLLSIFCSEPWVIRAIYLEVIKTNLFNQNNISEIWEIWNWSLTFWLNLPYFRNLDIKRSIMTLDFSQISVESVTANNFHLIDVYIWSLFHQYTTLLHGCNDANYEASNREVLRIFWIKTWKCSVRDSCRVRDKYPELSVENSF